MFNIQIAKASPVKREAAGDGAVNSGASTLKADPRYIVPGLVRGLDLLRQFTRERPTQTLSELAASLGLSRSAAFRLVYTLEYEGYVTRNVQTMQYQLTSKAVTFGLEFIQSLELDRVAQPVIRAVAEQTKVGVHLAMLEGWQTVYIDQVSAQVQFVTNLHVGTRTPVHTSASGRILLAYQSPDRLEEIFQLLTRHAHGADVPQSPAEMIKTARADRRKGYVYKGSIYLPGVVSFAAPIHGRTGEGIAALLVTGPRGFIESRGGERWLKRIVLDAAGSISSELGYENRKSKSASTLDG